MASSSHVPKRLTGSMRPPLRAGQAPRARHLENIATLYGGVHSFAPLSFVRGKLLRRPDLLKHRNFPPHPSFARQFVDSAAHHDVFDRNSIRLEKRNLPGFVRPAAFPEIMSESSRTEFHLSLSRQTPESNRQPQSLIAPRNLPRSHPRANRLAIYLALVGEIYPRRINVYPSLKPSPVHHRSR